MGKGRQDKTNYMQGTVRRQAAEATDPSDESNFAQFDYTESDSSVGQQKLAVATSPPPKQPNAFVAFLRDRTVEAVLVPLLLLFLAWVANQIYSMNRELGDHSAKLNDAKTSSDKLDKRLDDLEKRNREDLLRLQDQLERRTAPVKR